VRTALNSTSRKGIPSSLSATGMTRAFPAESPRHWRSAAGPPAATANNLPWRTAMPQPPGRLMLRMAAAILVTLCAGGAQSADRPDLELIMSDPDWIGNAPTGFYWSDSAGEIYFDQKRVGENFSDLYVVPAAGGEPRRVAPAEESKSSNASRAYNAARTMVAWIHRGDIMVRDLTSGQTRQLTRT